MAVCDLSFVFWDNPFFFYTFDYGQTKKGGFRKQKYIKKWKTYCKRLVGKLFGFGKSGTFMELQMISRKVGLYPAKGAGCFSLFEFRGFTRTYQSKEAKREGCVLFLFPLQKKWYKP